MASAPTSASVRLLAQVADWLQHEKTKRLSRETRHVHRRRSPAVVANGMDSKKPRRRSNSIDSESSDVSFDRLQRILDDGMSTLGLSSIPHLPPRPGRKSSKRWHQKSYSTLSKAASSDIEYFDGDVIVPACDSVLDNSKIVSYCGGDLSLWRCKEEKDKQAWIVFKNECIRLAHTLRLKGWRRVPLDSSETISVKRLSGALTNAVYVISPPEDWATMRNLESNKTPSKVLLRVYGPQVGHMIDRENELGVLRRLARKKIGPRLLGTFVNGRFEQYFDATALTPVMMRDPDISRHIGKRMRELHDGMDLLEGEKEEGPCVWKNWDKWAVLAGKTAFLLDEQVKTMSETEDYVCGVAWPDFRAMVEKYRKFLEAHYGGWENMQDQLVFAHNDTQYGNILRVRPDNQNSPLLRSANEHKQLIVIDFEYAGANPRALEFANHFTEWTYNYHDTQAPHVCHAPRYPNLDEQHRLIKAYFDHRPSSFPSASGSANMQSLTPAATTTTEQPTPPVLTRQQSASSIVELMRDARVAPGEGSSWKEVEQWREKDGEHRIQKMMQEARLWRAASSAFWVAWGIIQAKVPGLDRDESDEAKSQATVDETRQDGEQQEEKGEFDYLAYAHDRALFFWGDCVLLGLVTKEELPESLRGRLKLVPY